MNARQQIENALAALETQRAVLGDAVVDASQAALRKQLAGLDAPQPAEQRKLVSVLFADLVGFTALAAQLDPEDLRSLQQAYFAAVAAPIKQYGGMIEKYIGDAIVAVFGLPHAEEDDPDRAVRAALGMQAALTQLNLRPGETLGQSLPRPLQMRIGINTGMVVVSLSASGDFDILGDSVNLTSRLQSAAPPGGVLISHDTYRQVRGAFDIQPLEPLQVKGKSEPVQVYLVTAAKRRSFRTYKRGVEGIETRMVGRESELQTLQTAYFNAVEVNERGMVAIVADPGMGKSRLLYEFENWLDLRPEVISLFRGRARLETQRLPFGLWRDLFAFHFAIQDDDPLTSVWQKFELGLTEVGTAEVGAAVPAAAGLPDAQTAAHFIGQLLGYDFSASPHLQAVKDDPQQFQVRAVAYLVGFFTAMARLRPILILLEDLHWADDASLNLTQDLALRLAGQPLLIIATARPVLFERRAHWMEGQDFYLRLDLRPLTKRDSRRLVDDVFQKMTDIPESLRELVIANSDGNPYYVEELIKMLIDEGVILTGEQSWQILVDRLEDIHVPPTLAGLLQARLDSLPEAQHALLGQASVVGRVFWDRTLAYLGETQASGPEDVNLPHELAELRQKEMIFRHENCAFAGAQEYIFKHAMLREVAYEHVLKRQRRQYHQRAAEWLISATQACGRLAEYTGLIAEHYYLAGQALEAADWLIRAGERALLQSAFQEAGAFYDRALDLLPPSEGERRWLALKGRGSVLSAHSKHAELKLLNAELLALAHELNDESHLAEAHYRVGGALAVTGDDRAAVLEYEQALPPARRAGYRLIEAKILALMSISLVRLGEAAPAKDAADQAIQVALQIDDLDTKAQVLLNAAVCYIELGDTPEAIHTLNRSLETYQQVGNIHGVGIVLSNLGYNYVRLGLVEQGEAVLQESVKIHAEVGSRHKEALSGLNLGLAHILSANISTALPLLQQCTAVLQELADDFGQAAGLAYQAIALEAAGELDAAATCFDQAMRIHSRIGVIGYAMDAQAGLARCALAGGHLSAALHHAGPVWRYLTEQAAAGMEFPIWAYLTCAQVFQAAGDLERSRQAVSLGRARLLDKAAKISDPEWRRSYLENVPEHRSLLEFLQ